MVRKMIGATLSVVVLVSCGGGSDDEAATDTTQTTEAAATTEAVTTTTEEVSTTTEAPTTTAAPTTTVAPTTTLSAAALRGAENLFLISGLENNDATGTELRTVMGEVFVDALNYDRVNTINGSVTDEFGLVLAVDATYCAGCSDDFNQSAHIETVDTLAKQFWAPDLFGPVTEDGNLNGVVSLWLTADGMTYNLSAEQMIAIRDLTLSAQQAMGL